MTDELNSRARALLDAARDGLGPDDVVIARVRNRVVGGVATGTAASAASAGLAAKLTLVGLLVAVGGGAWLSLRGPAAPASSAPMPELAAPVEAQATSRFEMAAPDQPSAPALPARAPRRVPTAGPSLADEVALVDAAMAAVRAGDHARALAASERHAATFGARGQLAEEAAALRVEALCRLGDARADQAWDAFAARWPSSTQRPRIAAACKGAR